MYWIVTGVTSEFSVPSTYLGKISSRFCDGHKIPSKHQEGTIYVVDETIFFNQFHIWDTH